MFSNAILFLSFQMIQNKHKGATFRAFFLFFLMKRPNQVNNLAFLENCNSHTTPNKKTRCLNNFALLYIWKQLFYCIKILSTKKNENSSVQSLIEKVDKCILVEKGQSICTHQNGHKASNNSQWSRMSYKRNFIN